MASDNQEIKLNDRSEPSSFSAVWKDLPYTEVVVQSRSLDTHPNLGISCDLRSLRVSVAPTAEWEMQDL